MEQYPKILRFNLGERISQKGYLSPRDEEWLLSARLMIQEKMDGKPVRVENIIDPKSPMVNPFYDQSSHIPRNVKWRLLPPDN
ncbi:MAG: hypothetical protein NTV31_04930 [Bacteroidia bacterium]|nr:hypothetical protein [Bacteroidia bacterium]